MNELFQYRKAIPMYMSLHNLAPTFLLHKRYPPGQPNTGCNNKAKIINSKIRKKLTTEIILRCTPCPRSQTDVPKPNLEIYRKTFAYSGSKIWNTPPESIRSAPSLGAFKVQTQISKMEKSQLDSESLNTNFDKIYEIVIPSL